MADKRAEEWDDKELEKVLLGNEREVKNMKYAGGGGGKGEAAVHKKSCTPYNIFLYDSNLKNCIIINFISRSSLEYAIICIIITIENLTTICFLSRVKI